jgi:hypothetical protein
MTKISAVTFVFVFVSYCLCAQPTDFQNTDFSKADSIAELYPHFPLKDLKALAEKLTTSLTTEEEKFRSIFKWVCNNIENDYELYALNKEVREKQKNPEKLQVWNKKFSARVFQTLQTEYKTVCSGYGYLIQELSFHAGLLCKIVDGYGRTAHANIGGAGVVNHTWNAIQLKGKWYLCDATWSSGSIDPQQKKFIKKYDEAYFLGEPSLFIRNHYPIDTTWALLDNTPSLPVFLNGPLIYKDWFHYGLEPVSPETFEVIAERGRVTSFRFRNNGRPVAKIEFQMKRGENYHTVQPSSYRNTDGLYCVDYTFTTKGVHALHVLLDGHYALTYNIRVQ